MKVNETQFAAVERIIHRYTTSYGSGGSDQHRRRAALASLAVFAGKLASVPDEYKSCLAGIEVSGATDVDVQAVDPSIAANAKKAGLFEDIKFGRDEKNRPELLLGEHIAAVYEFSPGIYKASATVEELVAEASTSPDEDENLDDDEDDEFSDPLIEEDDASYKSDLEARTVTQLKSIASDCDVTIPSDATKATIIELLLDKAAMPMLEAALETHPIS